MPPGALYTTGEKVTSKTQPVDLPPEEEPMPTTGPLVPLAKA
jgi:hypothetical protein